jgi:hypothetical protein
MKSFITLLVLLVTLAPTIGYSDTAPKRRLTALEAGTSLATGAVTSSKILDGTIVNADISTSAAIAESKLLPPTSEGLNASRVARVDYNVATDLGTVGAHLLGVTLPAKAIIVRTWFYTVTQFTDTTTGTVAFHCEDANNLYTATDITGIAAGATTPGAVDGGAESTFVGSIGAACEITATVADDAMTAGRLIFFVEYFVGA